MKSVFRKAMAVTFIFNFFYINAEATGGLRMGASSLCSSVLTLGRAVLLWDSSGVYVDATGVHFKQQSPKKSGLEQRLIDFATNATEPAEIPQKIKDLLILIEQVGDTPLGPNFGMRNEDLDFLLTLSQTDFSLWQGSALVDRVNEAVEAVRENQREEQRGKDRVSTQLRGQEINSEFIRKLKFVQSRVLKFKDKLEALESDHMVLYTSVDSRFAVGYYVYSAPPSEASLVRNAEYSNLYNLVDLYHRVVGILERSTEANYEVSEGEFKQVMDYLLLYLDKNLPLAMEKLIPGALQFLSQYDKNKRTRHLTELMPSVFHSSVEQLAQFQKNYKRSEGLLTNQNRKTLIDVAAYALGWSLNSEMAEASDKEIARMILLDSATLSSSSQMAPSLLRVLRELYFFTPHGGDVPTSANTSLQKRVDTVILRYLSQDGASATMTSIMVDNLFLGFLAVSISEAQLMDPTDAGNRLINTASVVQFNRIMESAAVAIEAQERTSNFLGENSVKINFRGLATLFRSLKVDSEGHRTDEDRFINVGQNMGISNFDNFYLALIKYIQIATEDRVAGFLYFPRVP